MDTWVITTGLFINIWRLKTMSKIIIDEIEAKTTDVALTPNGTGTVEITGELVDATLQLNSSTQLNNVKIKSPPDSAGQSHTLILPDNDVDVDKYLQVKSVTGSGSTAVGQLEYATIANIDTTNLNADNFTTGSVSSSRMPASFPNTSGFALKLITKYTYMGGSVSTINFTGLDNDSQYILVAPDLSFSGTDVLEMGWLDASGNVLNTGNATGEKHKEEAQYNWTYYINSGINSSSSAFFNASNTNHFRLLGENGLHHPFIAEFNTDNYAPAMIYRSYQNYYNDKGMVEAWMSLNTSSPFLQRINGITLRSTNGNQFATPTEISLYKYMD